MITALQKKVRIRKDVITSSEDGDEVMDQQTDEEMTEVKEIELIASEDED